MNIYGCSPVQTCDSAYKAMCVAMQKGVHIQWDIAWPWTFQHVLSNFYCETIHYSICPFLVCSEREKQLEMVMKENQALREVQKEQLAEIESVYLFMICIPLQLQLQLWCNAIN